MASPNASAAISVCPCRNSRLASEVKGTELKGSNHAAHSTLFIALCKSPASANRCCSFRYAFDRYSETASRIKAPVTNPTDILKTTLPKTRTPPERIYIGGVEYKHATVIRNEHGSVKVAMIEEPTKGGGPRKGPASSVAA